ncbi:gluconolactonase [Neolewinella xylanilytica]|uniref:Gluconolactonase n=1 Tax=Neolewinella xylanilytica TaxID=1514080 RepID=A0A2S6I0G3_9BACT|nr:SMP-30/gluconolactonase/LRE family protein [Neolewinella xylanilytica]PPK84257.1 gluconolactonase [Neolewinella xylanilytica]
MRTLLLVFPLIWLLGCRSSSVPETSPPSTATGLRLEVHDAATAGDLFGDTLASEVLFGGMQWSEGPLVLPNGEVVCSDVPHNQVLRWTGTGSEVWLTNSGAAPDDYSNEPGSNGLALNDEGELLLAQHGSRRIARMVSDLADPQPRYEVIAAQYEGKPFNSPNDLVVASDGSIVFTDPPYGLPEGVESAIGFFGVYRVDPRGQVSLLTKEYERPNGIGLSPDERTLYISNSHGPRPIVTATPIRADWTLGQPAILIDGTEFVDKEPGYPDGMAVSRQGHLFATAPGGVWVVRPDGTLIAKIKSVGPVSNVALSPEEDWLYLTNADRLLRVKIKPI